MTNRYNNDNFSASECKNTCNSYGSSQSLKKLTPLSDFDIDNIASLNENKLITSKIRYLISTEKGSKFLQQQIASFSKHSLDFIYNSVSLLNNINIDKG